ncbi:SMI1/KNR4 family protein [Aphanothece hegewaldii CCALA 016]|uniref:SMI1/KNR4 family protein n=1 Tax=Aphanothece hegewaldii CCALA 016 TaxID=2107694 RepID=A0A2T1LTF7_9CHRO|nr:SMI1/KNR4 family protein [Aphanothece hegewaldii]PSF33624.1 SMI1/KNR4 family protein [Aphanothece hegewaldii CCALA 016]
MGVLTEALERIIEWLRQHQPEYANSFKPGLKSDEIKAAEEELGFTLPEEIYELYQWRNGSTLATEALFFPNIHFLPLDQARNTTREVISYPDDWFWYEGYPLFVFLMYESDVFAIPLKSNQQKNLPVVYIPEGGEQIVYYTSLTDMMLTLAECYETGTHYIDEQGYICDDEYKAAQISCKYNADLNEKALSTFQSLFLQPLESLDNKLIGQVADATIVISRFKDPRGVDLLLEALQVWRKIKGNSRDMVCCWVIEALGEMYAQRAIQPLTDALQDSSLFVKQEAQKALSKLRGS